MELTPEQLAAVNARGENFLIAAAAGSGKTRTLTERVLKLVEENSCEVDEMLIVTFTKAAANEMRTRIQSALENRLQETFDDELQTRLERQLILLNGAQISTFDSFCQSVLRRNFASIELDPKFRTADENELELLKREVIEDLFEENYSSGSETFKNFTDEFGGTVKGDSDIHDMIIDLHKFSLSMAHPESWLDDLPTPYNLPANARLEDTIWFKILKPNIDDALKKISDDCAQAQRLADKYKITVKIFADECPQVEALGKNFTDWNKLRDKLSAITFGTFRTSGGKLSDGQKIIKAQIQNLRDGYKSKINYIREKVFIADAAKIISDLRELYEPICELVRVTKAFDEKFSAAKRERGIIDFADMEHFALKIFETSPAVADSYREKFKFIMVDEYQDTNGVQEAIVQKISSGDNLFFVGDVKQSIYRFRLVDSKNFREKMAAYKCINLAQNFRSRKQILDAVNEIFKRLMIGGSTEITYDDDAALKLGASYESGENYFDERPEMFIIDADSDGDEKSIELEMRFIAGKIHELIESKKLVRDGEIYRPVELRDIVILHRSPKTKSFEILETLKKFGVPAYVPDEENYFKATEIQVMLSLLTLLDNARQDIPLAAVMLSPIGKFSAEELAELRLAERYTDFYTAVERGSDKCKNFLATLDRWRDEARQLSVPELLSKLYRETGYYDFVGRQERGALRQANLRMLIDRAKAFEETNARGLSRFVENIQKLRGLGKDLAAASILSESANVVHVVTIHGSKGLEYPVVFVAGCGKRFNMEDSTRGIIFHHSELGIGAHRTPKNSQLKIKTLATQAVSKKIAEESLAEELRTLYVALTRAQEKLILVGTATQSKLTKIQPVDSLTAQEILSANQFFDWLLPIKDALANVIVSKIVSNQNLLSIRERSLDAAQEKILQPPEKFQPTTENIPAKLSVTELKRRTEEAIWNEELGVRNYFSAPNFAYRRPNFLQTKKLSGAEFGTLMHKIMQSLNLSGDLSATGISAQVDELARREIIPAEHAKIVRTDEIAKFFKSKLGKRLLAAQEIYREMPFSRPIDAKKFFNVDEKIFVQGIIDLLFQDAAGRWILLDYKTDRDSDDIADRYRLQIDLYAAALEALLKLKISEKYLYLLGSGRLVEM
ncbi:MAG: helicase-exonuclease AddAB subunit AddA [Selenomonadaceae bacterium]|nr:helicase-exonuclease AddAB subunit AddA [Selenomonadaceae bacterium]